MAIRCTLPRGNTTTSHDDVIRKLLFRLAQWHALAKLCLHTDESLNYLEKVTRLLGGQLRKFLDFTCTSFNTMELPSETAAHWRRKAGKLSTSSSTAPHTSSTHPKLFNLATYKLHALGDYVHTIRLFGTTDSYTTQIVSHFEFLMVSYRSIITSHSRESLLINVSRNSISPQTSRNQQGRSQSKKDDIPEFGANIAVMLMLGTTQTPKTT